MTDKTQNSSRVYAGTLGNVPISCVHAREVNNHLSHPSSVTIKIEVMKAMTKQQLADCAGVSVRTLNSWCRTCQDELWALGLRNHMKVLPPNIVAFLADRFCIDIEP